MLGEAQELRVQHQSPSAARLSDSSTARCTHLADDLIRTLALSRDRRG